MDNNNGSPPQGGEPAMDAGDWRCQLQADSRQRIVNKIMDTLKRHIPYSSEDELNKIAVRFEEKIYVAAPSLSDYLSKISLKMLSMETKSQNTMANSLQSNSAGSSGMQPQVTSQGQLLSENIQSNIPPAGVQNSAGLSSALPPTSGPQQQILPPQHQPQQLIGLMDNNNGSPPQGGEPAMDAGDWRCQLQVDSRQRIVIKIMDTLKRHIPYSSEDELKKIAVRFEEKIYVVATSQSDYLRKISLKMLTMDTKSQNTMANSLQSNPAGSSGIQLLSENIQNNIPPAEIQSSTGLPSVLPHDSGPQQQTLPPQHQQQQFIGLMDNNNVIPPQGGEPAMDAGDWRSQLQADSRQRIVNKMMDTLKRNLPFSGQEGLDELKKIAVRFEEKIYVAATSQSDYLRKISLKMLTMDTKSQNTMANSLQSNSAGSSVMQPQVANQGQLLSENIQSNIPPAGVQNSTGLSSALPPTSGPQQQIFPPQHQPQQLIASLDSTAQTGNTNGADWKEEVDQKYQKKMQKLYIFQHDVQRQKEQQQQLPGQLQPELHQISVVNDVNTNALSSSQSGINMLQANVIPPSILQKPQVYQNQLQIQLLHQRQMQLQLMEKQQRIQQQQQAKQQVPGLSQAHQLPQLHQISVVKDVNVDASSSQTGSSMLQANIDPPQPKSIIVDNNHLKQDQEQKMFQNQLKQPYQQQWMQKQQMLQEMQQLQIQKLQQQAKQQLHHIYVIYLIFLTFLLGAAFFGTGY
ncbi:mediator of RNA polymerase II transcription subunit 15a-like [Rosa rugosa]|uniref:mediator of RNA polymerase II transcription subunit 15a-like n=1 Tax=Rosa rugosa TaxID=74645 RepID=UPI002B409CD7|nr:mediator of RNA polymerase II transcription subunit 15a-like [Rosa rugosa]